MGLTAEQMRRIEANRARARQLRMQRCSSVAPASGVRPSVAQPNANAKPSCESKLQVRSVVPSMPSGLTATCVLTGRRMFSVKTRFHAGLIDFFRSISKDKSTYDAATRTWSFSLDIYKSVVAGIQNVKPPVKFEGLPSFVLRSLTKSYNMDAVSDEELLRVDPKILERLFSFQKYALRFIISRYGRILLADDMGLGKTMEALAVASYYKSEWPLLIVCPSSLKYNWREEIVSNMSSIDESGVFVLDTSSEKKCLRMPGQVYIISYDLMVTLSEAIMNKKFKVVIMDECHNIKNFKTQRCQIARAVLMEARYVFLLSGTPALSKPIELYTQISCVAPALFNDFKAFGQRYCDPKEIKVGSRTVYTYQGASNLEELNLLLKATIMLRRSKQEVLHELPPKIRKTVVLNRHAIDLARESLQSAKSAYERVNKSVHRHEILLRFYAETAKIKQDAVVEYMREVIDTGEKLVVFAHHQCMLDAICKMLTDKRVMFIRIDGSVNSRARKEYCNKFQTSNAVCVAVLSISCAATGLTLTTARRVIFAELFWNPGVLLQAEDRTHRVGQSDSVLVEYLVAKGSADDQLWDMVKNKLKILKKSGLTGESFSSAETNDAKSKCGKVQTALNNFLDEPKQKRRNDDRDSADENSANQSV